MSINSGVNSQNRFYQMQQAINNKQTFNAKKSGDKNINESLNLLTDDTIAALDKDNDGKISKEEAKDTFLEKIFDEVDKNGNTFGDGKLSCAEIFAGYKALDALNGTASDGIINNTISARNLLTGAGNISTKSNLETKIREFKAQANRLRSNYEQQSSTKIKNAFSYNGDNAKTQASKLQENYIIDRPISSRISNQGTVDYGTGRIDNATIESYDSQGRPTKITLKPNENSRYKNVDTEITYSYKSNGEYTETELDKTTGVIIETTYNKDGSIKNHKEYMNANAKAKGNAVVERNYTYSIDKNGNPVQTMKNSAGVTVTTTMNTNGTYSTKTERK